VLRRKFRCKREKVIGDWRRLHNEDLRNMYDSPDIITVIKSRRMGWAGHVARMGAIINAYNILVGKSEGTRPSHRWKDNIKIDLRETLWEVEWIHVAQDRDSGGLL
jgi:hypothetical protein